ncbi:MAG: hypothetical protein JHD16_00540 [Solirubrobacteraceae bacterium]|nr:hypothetical protein [Solirubrobacteraceae bacterium]
MVDSTPNPGVARRASVLLDAVDDRWRTAADIHDRAGRVTAYAQIAHTLGTMVDDGILERRPNACEWTGAPAYRRTPTAASMPDRPAGSTPSGAPRASSAQSENPNG